MNITINNVEVALTSKNGKAFATSLDVAKVFKKEHKNILRDINNFPKRVRLNFELKYYISKNNKQIPMYKMTRDGFSLLVMGFTGQRAYREVQNATPTL
jgi:Rha family phage regulatory protein